MFDRYNEADDVKVESLADITVEEPVSVIENNEVEKNVADIETTKILDQLNKQMEVYQDFLNRDLTLGDVANKINVPPYKLSRIINEQLKKNFFTMINEYRIEEAGSRIISGEYDNLTLSAIGYDSGFNSRSTFHSLFKKYKGLTPSQFRKSK